MSFRLPSLAALSLALLPAIALQTYPQAHAQSYPQDDWAVEADARYRFSPNVTYVTEDGIELSLDVYSRQDVDEPQPTLVFHHGGFWVFGSKNTQLMALLPWLEMGWNVVNVGYRLADQALAPAALVDSFCALRFIGANAEEFNIDTDRIVTSGQSAGGHLALSLAMLDETEFDLNCQEGETPEVAAVINWYGVTDVPDVISGENRSDIAARWFGDMEQERALELARQLSPLEYVRDGLPPILSIQGDEDTIVPYAQGVALHDVLGDTDVQNRLLTIPGGGHGRFTATQRQEIYEVIREFLESAGLGS